MTWLKLAHRTAIVTGAGSGIGAAVALELAKQQCRVVLADVVPEKLLKVVEECESLSPVKSVVTDVTSQNQVRSLMNQADEFASVGSGCSILVNCAGITRDGFISKLTTDQWDEVLDVNLRGTFHTCQAFCDPSRLDSIGGKGSIVNVGSIVSEQGNLGQVNYAASKGGVVGLTRALAKEMASRTNVRVNAVLPGFIDTEMSRAVPEQIREQIVTRIALKRFGQPEDIANLVLFLASCERSGYITGECMTCSGMISL